MNLLQSIASFLFASPIFCRGSLLASGIARERGNGWASRANGLFRIANRGSWWIGIFQHPCCYGIDSIVAGIRANGRTRRACWKRAGNSRREHRNADVAIARVEPDDLGRRVTFDRLKGTLPSTLSSIVLLCFFPSCVFYYRCPLLLAASDSIIHLDRVSAANTSLPSPDLAFVTNVFVYFVFGGSFSIGIEFPSRDFHNVTILLLEFNVAATCCNGSQCFSYESMRTLLG